MHIVITGGTGLVGRRLCKALHEQGHQVSVIGNKTIPQESIEFRFIRARLIDGEIPSVFSDCDAIIHLAGANIFHRWTKSYKQLILDTRVKTAQAIYNYLSKQTKRAKIFISASAIGFYGNRGDEILDETSSPGTGFLSHTCVEWEMAREKFSSLDMRTVSIRTGTVISRDGGFLSKIVPLFRLRLGGNFGNGKQWFPWIHIDDLVNIYIQAVLDPRFSGPINAVAPKPIRNTEFTKALKEILKKPAFLSVPSFALKLSLGELASVILFSQRVVPRRLENLGFSYHYPTIEKALRECIDVV